MASEARSDVPCEMSTWNRCLVWPTVCHNVRAHARAKPCARGLVMYAYRSPRSWLRTRASPDCTEGCGACVAYTSGLKVMAGFKSRMLSWVGRPERRRDMRFWLRLGECTIGLGGGCGVRESVRRFMGPNPGDWAPEGVINGDSADVAAVCGAAGVKV